MTIAAKATPTGRYRAIAGLGLPFLVGVLSSSLDGVIDTAMMGRYGADDLAAVAGGSAIFDVFTTVAVATVVGHQILAARFAGRADGDGIRSSLRATALLSSAVVAPLFLACLLFGSELTAVVTSGSADAVPTIGGGYLAAVAVSLPLTVAFTAVTATFNAFTHARQPMIAGLIVAGSNIVLDWLLIHGWGPFPRLGATGNGLATSIAWLLGLAVLLTFARQKALWTKLRGNAAENPADFETSVVKLSVPAMVSTGVDYASTAVFFGIVGSVGAGSLGGGRIAFHVLVLVYGLGAAFGAATRILIGRAVGAGNTGDIRGTWQAGRVLLLVPAIVVAAALILLRDGIAAVFTGYAQVQAEIANALVVVGLIVPVVAWTLANLAVIRAFGKTKWDMYSNLIAATVVQLPIAWVMSVVLDLGVVGAFVGMAAYWVVRGVLVEVWAGRCVRDAEHGTKNTDD
ncbi:MATE family efflux transporter [Saccharomonospora sp.]|uniref:MATE family efflux transporter n=1 Tax=Saccharomonospora sp. TaxID=33913 RepID=UPI0026130B9F|nr:MATE family efflux transporter [Saccharomonospora sp.]